MLYSLSIIDNDSDSKIFDLRCYDADNELLYNGPDLFLLRGEYSKCNIINTSALVNDIGFSAEYDISKDIFSYERLGDVNVLPDTKVTQEKEVLDE